MHLTYAVTWFDLIPFFPSVVIAHRALQVLFGHYHWRSLVQDGEGTKGKDQGPLEGDGLPRVEQIVQTQDPGVERASVEPEHGIGFQTNYR